ncbi:MAG: sigma-70 family RNA polymerase sigma factor [Gemmatimonadota bacterium]|jgi:RNA polymerase sigma-70 factor (ECF subfamily)
MITETPAEAAEMDLASIRAGERVAFERLVHETWSDLVDHLTWILGSRPAAEDASQEAFIRVWEKRERWRDGSARALVFRIGRNVAFDERRRERVRRAWVLRQASAARPAIEPEDRAEASEQERRFRKALLALTPARREVIELVRLRGLTHREAAEALGIAPQTVSNRMTLALADLRLLLSDLLPASAERTQAEEGPGAATDREMIDG